MDIVSAGTALIRIVSVSVQSDHHAGLAFFSCHNSVMSYLECFVDICQGSKMGSCTLQCGEFYRTGLQPCLSRYLVSQSSRTAGKLLVSESIHEIGSIAQLAYETSVSQSDAFRYGNNNGRLGFGQIFYLFHELVHIKGYFRKVDCIRSGAVITAA